MQPTFTLLGRWVNEADPQTVVTQIKFVYSNGQQSILNVQHFRPTSDNDLATNIDRAGKAEWLRLKAVAAANLYLTSLDQYLNMELPFVED